MTKKEIKQYFRTIRAFDLKQVEKLVGGNPEYIAACSSDTPKKDDGQSGLQVAFKIAALDIAKYLIEKGADVNFMEQSQINEWRIPVLQDCIRAVFSEILFQNKRKKFDTAFSLLRLMLDKGADPNAVDSFGNNALFRAGLDSRTIFDSPHFEPEPPSETIDQMRMVFRELIRHGANVEAGNKRLGSLNEFIVEYGYEKYGLLNFDNLREFEVKVEQKGFWRIRNYK